MSTGASPKEGMAGGLARRLAAREAVAGVIGLGYVGLPLVAACLEGGFHTLGFDTDADKITRLGQGLSCIEAVKSSALKSHVEDGSFHATADLSHLARCDVIAVCVPTPLTQCREPDLRYVEATAEAIADNLRPGQLVVLESTTYPGTTDEIVKPILERGGLKSGRDFFIGYSPERQDPGNTVFETAAIPKVVAGDGETASSLTEAFYRAVVDRVVCVSAMNVAEAVKITENVFRAVNIALVNELKVIYEAMGIDVWEVVEAASTKPFGFMPFHPGPGLGGHCIPIDPFYLSWKAREHGLAARFVELAGEINVAMPHYVVSRLETALGHRQGRTVSAARILVLGLAYKKNVADIRESPSLRLIQMLKQRGATVEYSDPHVPRIAPTRDYGALAGLESVTLASGALAAYHAVLIATDHDAFDYRMLADHASLILDARNAMEHRGITSGKVVKA